MSIRLRMTLLYTAILTLTLFIFGIALFSIQAQDSLSALKSDLYQSSSRFSETAIRMISESPSQDNPPPKPPQPQSFDEFANEQLFQDLREREIIRILDAEGNLLVSPFGREEDALPLSAEGLIAVQIGQGWLETTNVDGEEMLIYSRPVIQNGETTAIVQVARSLAERNRNLQTLATTLIGAGFLTILVAFAAGWLLSGLALRPIDRITLTAQSIGDERDFTRRVAYSGPPDEIGRLASTFNQMLERLQQAYEKVEHSLQMQRDFVADVSHELRTPLTTLRGNVELLRHEPPAPAEVQTDILTDLAEESDRLIRLVNDLLMLARADAGRNLVKEPLLLQPLLEDTVRQMHLLETERPVRLAVSPGLHILGDRDAFKQVMLIVLDNALKHSSGEIDVQAGPNGSLAEIRVQDHGPGMSPENLERIFDRFYRGDNSQMTSGLGLGLPIAKTLVEGMGGTISIESEEARGSVVILRFGTS
ncbi:MAG: HAMP domain-containing protein [Caldilineales bacterium]|nr:HAMP domain-containing protein [Caldilineales bacterium]